MPTIAGLPNAAQGVSTADYVPIDQSVGGTFTTGKISLGSLLTLLAAEALLPSGIILGMGAPSSSQGTNGWSYINANNGDLWLNTGGTWGKVGNIAGPAGVAGPTGPAGPTYSITGLSTVGVVAGTDLVGISQGGADRNVTLANLLDGQTIDQGSPAAPVSDGDTFWAGQGGSTMLVQRIGDLWPWITGKLVGYKLPVVEVTSNLALDGSAHNGRLLICSQPVTISPSGTMGSGFTCTIINVSAGTCNLAAGFTTSSGNQTLTSGQSAIVSAAAYSAGTVYYAMIAGGASTPPAPPGAPIGLTAGTPTASTVPLSWTAPGTGGAPASYTVQYRVTGGSGWTPATGISGLSYSVTGLVASTGYDFQVQAVNAGGSSAFTATTNATTAAGSPPGVPTGLSAGAPTSSSVVLSWTAPSVGGVGATYNTQYQVQGAGSWTAGPSTSGTSVTVSGLTASTTYNFQVQAVNGGLTSAWTDSVSEATTAATNYLLTVAVNPASGYTAAAGTGGIPVNVNDNSVAADGSHTLPANVKFGWSASNSTAPTTLTSAAGTSQSIPGDVGHNLWYQWINGPATAGAYYFWAIAYNASGANVAQYVSPGTFAFT